jgi:hypothetical protein
VVELTHSGLNPRFDMSVAFTANYFFSGIRRSVDSETLLLTDFMNLKIKVDSIFQCAHRNKIYIHIFIRLSHRKCKRQVHPDPLGSGASVAVGMGATIVEGLETFMGPAAPASG